MASTPREVDGEHVLYHYLQKHLSESDIWLFQMLTARLVVSLGIWLPTDVYSETPILLPFARRDSAARGNSRTGAEENWGSADSCGYFRDDNTLVKGLVRSLSIRSPLCDIYAGRRLGTGFVASHVWRVLNTSTPQEHLASVNPETYSFVPNLVWLPKQVSKLSDREGSFVQQYLQALSHKVYSNQPVRAEFEPVVAEIWDRLPAPPIPPQGLPGIDELSFFDCDGAFIQKRRDSVQAVIRAARARLSGEELGKVISSRYGPGLAALPDSVLVNLIASLTRHLPSPESSEVLDKC